MSDVTLWILGDQLCAEPQGLASAAQVLMIESAVQFGRLPYHRQKRVLVASAMRHYAETLRARGVQVDYQRARDFATGLKAHVRRFRPSRIATVAAADFTGRRWQTLRAGAAAGVPVEVLPNRQFLVGQFDPQPGAGGRLVLEQFYRALRRRFGILMAGDAPVGGRWNFDRDNRRPLPRSLQPPPAPVFVPDAITREVIAEVRRDDRGIGDVDGFGYAVTHRDAARALADFVEHRLDHFGTYQDAMTTRHRTLYHAVISPYLNLGLLEPLTVVAAATAAYESGRAPLNSVEGFVRQVVGWREYMYWHYWRLMPGLAQSNHWGARRALPAFLWTGDTPMRCIREVVRSALATGYNHHIERLMVLANFALLCGLEPQAVTAWMRSLYVDAYDWVMQSNVVGMGLNADGGRIATKPYMASANYIHRMSDYCRGCAFDRSVRTGESACPFNYLYWNFAFTHEADLRRNPRVRIDTARFAEPERAAIQAQAGRFLEGLENA
jgi:deoxyribodipyrimidine photolyase-related protein